MLQQIFPIMLLTWFYNVLGFGCGWLNVTQFPGKASSKCLSLQGDNNPLIHSLAGKEIT